MTSPFTSRDTIAELARKLEADMEEAGIHHERVQALVNPGRKKVSPLSNEPSANGNITSGSENWEVDINSDGTTTIVQIVDADGDVFAEGVARRRKGDRRMPELGIALAAGRAFQQAASVYAKVAEDIFEGRL